MHPAFRVESGFFDATGFSQENFALGSSRSDDSQVARPIASPVFALLVATCLNFRAHFMQRTPPLHPNRLPDSPLRFVARTPQGVGNPARSASAVGCNTAR